MSDRNHDLEWEKLVDDMKNQHNAPPEVPRERMWQRIAAERKLQGVDPHPTQGKVVGRITPQVWRLTAAAAAVLLLGISIGRMTLPDPRDNQNQTGPGQLAVGPDSIQDAMGSSGDTSLPGNTHTENPGLGKSSGPGNQLLYRKAAADLFGRADVLLTGFKVTPCVEQDLETVPDWAGGMLLQTRLLMNTPMARDLEMKRLLQDLELVLAQIVGLNKENCARDVAWIRDAMAENSTLERLRLLGESRAAWGAL